MKKILAFACTLLMLCAAVLLLLWLFFWERAKKAQAKRDALVAKIANAGEEAPTHEEYRQLMDLTDYMLSLCKLAPQTGEFREEYASRLAKACAASLTTPTEEEGIKEHEKPHYALTETRLQQTFAAVAAVLIHVSEAVDRLTVEHQKLHQYSFLLL